MSERNKMHRFMACVPFETWRRLAKLGQYSPNVWPTGEIGDLYESASKGIRRAMLLANPLIDAEIAKIEDAYARRVAERTAWLDGEPRRTEAYIKRAAKAQGLEPKDF